MDIILVRHAQTEYNAQDRVLGRTDIPLSELGLRQAERLGQRLAEQRIDKIFSSPLLRAVQTAQAIRKAQKLPCELEIAPALIEMDFGIWEGQPRKSEEYQNEKRRYFSRFQNGESYFDVAARAYAFLRDIAGLPFGRCALVTHNGICRVITSYFQDMENEEFISFVMDNCETREFCL